MKKPVPTPVPATQRWNHWRDVKPEQWPWKHFTPEEIACRGTGQLVVHKSAMDKLEALRVDLGTPIILNSAYRSPSWNQRVGGEPNSYHKAERSYGGELVMAFDCSMANHEPNAFWAKAAKHGFRGRGDYPRQGFMHIDTANARTWTGKGQGHFPQAVAKKVEDGPQRFDAEKPAVIPPAKTLLSTDVLVPVGSAFGMSGLGAAVGGNGPLAWAFGFAVVAGVLGLGWYLFARNRNKLSVTQTGMGD